MASSGTAVQSSPERLEGVQAPDFRGLPGVDGERYCLDSFSASPVLCLIFTGNACPTAKAWDDELVRLQEGFEAFGVQIVMINPNNPYLSPPDTFELMVRRAGTAGFNFPYLKDEGGNLAKSLGALCTPQVFVFDGERALRYTGRIADSRRPKAVVRYDLREAISELVAGTEVSVPATDPFGCALVI